jgi:hypothetical protein
VQDCFKNYLVYDPKTMAIYAVIPLANNFGKLTEIVKESFPDDDDTFLLSANAGYLINFSGTSQTLGKKLFITAGKDEAANTYVGSALIVPFTSYWGRGATTMWDWIKARLEGEG